MQLNPALEHSAGSSVLPAPDLASAIRLATHAPGSLVEVFLTDWSEVDSARAHLEAVGLAGRVAVHHRAALVALVHLRILPAPAGLPAGTPAPSAPLILDQFLRAVSAACGTRRLHVTNPTGALQ